MNPRAFCIAAILLWLTAGAVHAADPPPATDIAYYPSYNKLYVSVIAAATSTSAALSLTDAQNAVVWQTAVPLTAGKADSTFTIPDLKDGEYTVKITSPGTPDFIYVITRQHYAWEGNQLGITDQVYPPFTPLTVAGHTVGMVLRQYNLSPLGLMDQVTSEGTPLLSSPMRLVANGQPLAGGVGRVVTAKPDVVVYQGNANSPAVTVSTRDTIDYDGCMKVEMTLAPGDGKTSLNSLTLEIPLTDKECPLWHAAQNALRANPAGFAPAGQGVVWDSTKFHALDTYGTFLPYVWLGGEERGLSWFGDNDAGWVTDPGGKQPCLTLERQGADLVLKVHLVQVPIVLTAPRTLVFGLMASPAKPMPADWRNVVANRVRFGWVGSEYFGGAGIFSAKYPLDYDYGFLDKVHDALAGKTPDFDYAPNVWIPKHFTPDMEGLRGHFQVTMHAMMSTAANKPDYFTTYFEEHSANITAPEVKTFGWEWQDVPYPWWSTYLRDYAGKPLTDMKQMSLGVGYGGAPSFTDFAVWYGSEFIKRGIGLYFDNVFLRRSRNVVATDAYPNPGPGVDIQPSALIWAQRDYYKRIWVLHHTLAPADAKPIMVMHMTNADVLPLVSFAMAQLDLEWKDQTAPAQTKYTPDLLRAESTGRQGGNLPMALGNIMNSHSAASKEQAERTRFGVFMVHEIMHPEARYPLLSKIRDFGYGLDDCKVWDYWDPDYPVKVSDDRVKSLFMRRGQEGLILLCSWIPERLQAVPPPDADALPGSALPADANTPAPGQPFTDPIALQFNLKQVGLNFTSAVDEETGEKLPVDAAGNVTVPLAGYGVRLLRLKTGP